MIRREIEYDHHCKWVGKCVAKNNIFSFNVFLMSTLILILYLFVACFFSLYAWNSHADS